MENKEGNIFEWELGAGARAFTAGRAAALPCPVTCGHQVHGTAVAEVTRPGMTREDLEGYDAFVTRLPGIAIGVRTADCIPVLLYDPVQRAVAAVHAGWRGTVSRVPQRAISEMARLYGTQPADIHALIGPGISLAAFQVGEEVVTQFRTAGFPLDLIYSWQGPKPLPGSQASSSPTAANPFALGGAGCGHSPALQAGSLDLASANPMAGGHHLDLKEANRWLLLEAGVQAQCIEVSDLCTYADARFYSARREGISCGRNISAITLL